MQGAVECGVVDQRVDPAERIDRRLRHRARLPGIRHVEPHRLDPPAGAAHLLDRRGAIGDVGGDDARALGGQPGGVFLPDAAGGAGDDHDLVRDAHRLRPPPRRIRPRPRPRRFRRHTGLPRCSTPARLRPDSCAPSTLCGSHQDWPVRTSNSQPCHGQRRISPAREKRYCPGSLDSTRPPSTPSASGPPWCGQRLSTPKNSPPMLKTAIGRPRTLTSLREPGGMSRAAATTCLLIGWFRLPSAADGRRYNPARIAAIGRSQRGTCWGGQPGRTSARAHWPRSRTR